MPRYFALYKFTIDIVIDILMQTSKTVHEQSAKPLSHAEDGQCAKVNKIAIFRQLSDLSCLCESTNFGCMFSH